jgi:hypothetical protein
MHRKVLQKALDKGYNWSFMLGYVAYPVLGSKWQLCILTFFAHNLPIFFAMCGSQKRICLQFFLQILVGHKKYYKRDPHSSFSSLIITDLEPFMHFLINWLLWSCFSKFFFSFLICYTRKSRQNYFLSPILFFFLGHISC